MKIKLHFRPRNRVRRRGVAVKRCETSASTKRDWKINEIGVGVQSMKNHEGKNAREKQFCRKQSDREASAIFRAPYVRKCHVNLSRACLTGILFSPYTHVLCVTLVILWASLEIRPDVISARVGIKFYLRGKKTALRLRNSRFHRNRYIWPTDCKLAILFSLVQYEIGDWDIGRSFPTFLPLTGNSICEQKR